MALILKFKIILVTQNLSKNLNENYQEYNLFLNPTSKF